MYNTVCSVIIMLICSAAGFFLGLGLDAAFEGATLAAIISGIACIIYRIDHYKE